MIRVLVVATGRKTRGGITSVIKAHETGDQWSKYHCHWIQTHRDGPNWRKLCYLTWAWADYIVRLPFYDIVHIHFSLRTTAKRKHPFMKLAKALGKKVIVHLHCGSQIDEIWNCDYEYMFRNADVSLFLSETLMQKVASHIGADCDFRVCYNPCPLVRPDGEATRKKQVLFSGTLYEGKGYRDLIKAFGRVARRFPDWKLVLAGNGETEIGMEIAENLGVISQVEFLGWISGEKKDEAFRVSSILCLPSYAEGFPMAVLDAWAYGLPVITTPVGGIPDVAVDGENMLLFPPGDIDALADKLVMMMMDENLRQRIGQASLDFARKKFNVKTINRQLDELYAELGDGHGTIL